jgi:hypothetical protein
MKELGAEFSKAKTAVEIKYHAGTQYEAIGEFVGGEASQPSRPTGKSEIRMSKSEIEGNAPSTAAAVPERHRVRLQSQRILQVDSGVQPDEPACSVALTKRTLFNRRIP